MTSLTEEVFEPGRILDGKYRIEGLIGEGGMGRVLKAHHLHLNEPRAIKVPKPELMARPQSIARFMKEARVASKITSEYVARIHDLGKLESGMPFIVMEYLDGLDLAALLSKGGPMPVDVLVDLMLQTCEALAEAHSIGIVHRDLKPPNLYCVRRCDGTSIVKVLDFGISKMKKMQSVTSAHLTQAGAMLGSPHYMSPEQSQSATEVDARTDIWSLGVILYELLSGSVPFAAESLQGLGVRIATSLPKPLSQLREGLGSELDVIVSRCLEKQAADRYQTVAELAWALAPFGSEGAKLSAQRTQRIIETARSANLRPPASEPPSEATPANSTPANSTLTTASPERRSDAGWRNQFGWFNESTLHDAVNETNEYVQADSDVGYPFTSTVTPPRGTHAPVTKSSIDGLDSQVAVVKRASRGIKTSIGLISASTLALLAWTLSGSDEPPSGSSGASLEAPPPPPIESQALPPGDPSPVPPSPQPSIPPGPVPTPSSISTVPPAPTVARPKPPSVITGPTTRTAPTAPKTNPATTSNPPTRPTSDKPPNCTPPFVIDEAGNKRFKRECF